jgi:hypothetical protein
MFLVPVLGSLLLQVDLGERVGEVAGSTRAAGVGVAVLLSEVGRVDAAHVHPAPVLVRVQRRLQLAERAAVQRYPEPAHSVCSNHSPHQVWFSLCLVLQTF